MTEKKKEPKMWLGIDISKWGQAVTVIIAIAAILISIGGAKYQISDARADIKDLNTGKDVIKQDFDEFKNHIEEKLDSISALRTRDLLQSKETEMIITQKVIPTLDRIDKSVMRLEDKMDRHLFDSQEDRK